MRGPGFTTRLEDKQGGGRLGDTTSVHWPVPSGRNLSRPSLDGGRWAANIQEIEWEKVTCRFLLNTSVFRQYPVLREASCSGISSPPDPFLFSLVPGSEGGA